MMDKITSATVFPKLRFTLEGDVKALEEFVNSVEDGSPYLDMVESLTEVKRHILSLFPANPEGIGGASSPPQRNSATSYEGILLPPDSTLVSKLHEVECKQMEFVKYNISDEGMPKELSSIIDKILNIYTQVTEQLGRSKKTSQPNTIVI